MKKKIILLSFILSPLANAELAYDGTIYHDWDGNVARSIRTYSYTFLDETIEFNSFYIDSSEGGKLRFYVMPSVSRNGESISTCKIDEDIDTSIWRFGNQNIKMILYCSKHKNIYSLSATPSTDKGLKFVVETLKKSSQMIEVEAGSIGSFKIPVKGFTNAWNAAGGDAI